MRKDKKAFILNIFNSILVIVFGAHLSNFIVIPEIILMPMFVLIFALALLVGYMFGFVKGMASNSRSD